MLIHFSMARESIQVDLHRVELSNLEKVLFPDEGITKKEFVEYYERIADTLLPHIRGRMIVLERFPNGINDGKFYQKQAPDYFPQWINRVTVALKEGGSITQITCEDKETLIYLANQVCILHVWPGKADKPEYPDRLIFDLDPPDDEFEPVRYAALILKEFLHEVGLASFAMTTGSRGLHVVVPLNREADFPTVNKFAQNMADILIRLEPDFFTNEFIKEEREGRMFVDVRRNIYGQTTVAPYAVRPKPGAPVAAPLEWSDLKDRRLSAKEYTIRNIFGMLNDKGDPWEGIFQMAYSLEKPQRRLKYI